MNYPKISIVTPVFNQMEYIEQTILSVLNQGYPNLEYIIIDGQSTDGTVEIIKKYEKELSHWVSEPDMGMYDALNKGLRMTSGEIMGWINSDDVLLPGAFYNMCRLFNDLPDVSWIQGLNSFIDREGFVIDTHPPDRFSFIKFLRKDYEWIQQESTMWRRSLWVLAGNGINDTLKLAGDFDLWFRFSQHTKLYNAHIPIGAWRKRQGQLSGSQMRNYKNEVNEIIDSYQINGEMASKIAKIKTINRYIRLSKKFKIFNTEYLIKKRNTYYNLEGIEIGYSHVDNKFIVL